MIRPVIRDVLILGRRSADASEEDIPVGHDLCDTLEANSSVCAGMAANMIGVNKRIIAFSVGAADLVMYNPVIVRKDSPYEAEEGCLSLDGVRKTVRYRNIEVEFLNGRWKKQKIKLSGWPAQICQHEIDHLNGIII